MQIPGGERFTCLGCGECCRIRGFVRVSAEEIDRIAAYLVVDPQAFIHACLRLSGDRGGLELEEKENGECVFLLGNECVIHPVKPAQCRNFPVEWRYPGVDEICPSWRRENEIQNPKSQTPKQTSG